MKSFSELITAPNIERTISAATGTVLLGAAVRRGGLWGVALGGFGVAFLAQAVRGRPSLARAALPERIEMERSITIEATPADLYAFWRDFENVPRFMKHIASVRIVDEHLSEWTAIGPGGARIRWRCELTDDRPNEQIGWRSVDRSPIDQSGTVRFEQAPEGGTEVRLSLRYAPPPGTIGIIVSKLLVGVSAHKMQEDLRHLKQLYETGSIPTTAGQPHGKRGRMRRFAQKVKSSQRIKAGERKLIEGLSGVSA